MKTTPVSEGQSLPRLSDITGAHEVDSFAVFVARPRSNGRVSKTALDAAREYEHSVTNNDDSRFAAFVTSHLKIDRVAKWVCSLSSCERKELGL